MSGPVLGLGVGRIPPASYLSWSATFSLGPSDVQCDLATLVALSYNNQAPQRAVSGQTGPFSGLLSLSRKVSEWVVHE